MSPLVVYPHAGILVGGSTHSALKVSKFLREHGWNIIHVFPALGPGVDITIQEGFEVEILGFSEKDVLVLRNTKGLVRRLRSLIPQLKDVLAARRWLISRRPVLVHVNDDRTMFSWGLAAKQLGIPVIWHVHQQRGDRLLDRIRLRLADHIIYVAQTIKSRFDGLQRMPAGTVLYNSVDPEAFKPPENKQNVKRQLGLDPNSIAIGFIGNLVPRKRPEWVVISGAELLQEGIDVEIVFAGSDFSGGPYQQRLRKIAETSGAPERFRFLGYRTDIPEIMQAIDILVLPSIPMGEALPLVVLEAMASSVAVVATKVAGIPEIIQDGKTGFLTSPEDLTEMIEKLKYLCENPQIIELIGKQARMQVLEKLTPEVTLKRLLKIYADLIGECK